MTKVQLHYPLTRPLEDADLDAISTVHAVYGMMRVQATPALDALEVDYDASRLMERDVEAVLKRFGLPIGTVVPAA